MYAYNMAYNFIAYCSRWSRQSAREPRMPLMPRNLATPSPHPRKEESAPTLVICAFVRDERPLGLQSETTG